MEKITNTSDSFMEDNIWMSSRYCIGRKTISASMHANDMALFLSMNPNIVPNRDFLAVDIRKQINFIVGLNWNVHNDNNSNKIDILSLLCQYMYENNIIHPESYMFEIRGNEVKATPTHTDNDNVYRDFDTELQYMSNWIKLANWMDPQYLITYKNEKGEESTEMGFKYYDRYRDKILEHVVTNNLYISNPFQPLFIDPKYIVKIEKVYG